MDTAGIVRAWSGAILKSLWNISFVGVLPVKIPFVELVDVKRISTSPCMEAGFVVVDPDAFSFTMIILHFPSSDAWSEEQWLPGLEQESSIILITASKNSGFTTGSFINGQTLVWECCICPWEFPGY